MENEKLLTLESAVRDTYKSVIWSQKIQDKQADIYSRKYKRLELLKIISASLTSAGVFSLIFTDQLWLKIISTLVSFITICINALFKSFDLQAMVSQHKAAGNNLVAVRDELKLILLNIRLADVYSDELKERYEAVVKQLNKVYADAPITSAEAVSLARIALKETKDNDFSKDDIDSYLPVGSGKD